MLNRWLTLYKGGLAEEEKTARPVRNTHENLEVNDAVAVVAAA
jgi:hypothetical protein